MTATPGRRALLGGATAGLVLPLSLARSAPGVAATAMGPLRPAPGGRYFMRPDGRALLLAGSHVWTNLQDLGGSDPPTPFGFAAHLDLLARLGHNLTRIWSWDSPMSGGTAFGHASPMPWLRTGPGLDAMGRPRFDLTRFDPAYFARLRARAEAARARGIWAVVMLWNTWALHDLTGEAGKNPWPFHPMAAGNNVNGIDGDPRRTGSGAATQTLAIPEVTALQDAYMRQVVETVGGLDHILYEITNEPLTNPATSAWQRAMVGRLRAIQAARWGEGRPIGVTGGTRPDPATILAQLLESGSDWISPTGDEFWHASPPEADGRRVSLLDTDHVFGVGGDALWMWKAFCRGHNLLAMDSFTGQGLPGLLLETPPALTAVQDSGRLGLQDILRAAARVGMQGMAPRGPESSTGYLLADPGRAWIMLAPEGRRFTLDLSAAAGQRLHGSWLVVEPRARPRVAADVTLEGGARRQAFTPPFAPAALVLTRTG
jgi:hypothetical protein